MSIAMLLLPLLIAIPIIFCATHVADYWCERYGLIAGLCVWVIALIWVRAIGLLVDGAI